MPLDHLFNISCLCVRHPQYTSYMHFMNCLPHFSTSKFLLSLQGIIQYLWLQYHGLEELFYVEIQKDPEEPKQSRERTKLEYHSFISNCTVCLFLTIAVLQCIQLKQHSINLQQRGKNMQWGKAVSSINDIRKLNSYIPKESNRTTFSHNIK